RQRPWASRALVSRTLNAVLGILDRDIAAAPRLFEALSEPFAVRALDLARLQVRASIGLNPALPRLCVDGLAPLEPHVPWDGDLLQGRWECYRRVRHPLAATARADLDLFLSNARGGH